jgi:hypothetical protein
MNMKFDRTILLVLVLTVTMLTAAAIAAGAEQAAPSASAGPGDAESSTTIRGCLSHSRGNYIVVEDKTGMVYALKGVGNKLDGQLGHEVSVTGRLRPGTMKTGVRSAKEGSNPTDTVHGVDGTPFQVNDVRRDVQTLSSHCKAADAQ